MKSSITMNKARKQKKKAIARRAHGRRNHGPRPWLTPRPLHLEEARLPLCLEEARSLPSDEGRGADPSTTSREEDIGRCLEERGDARCRATRGGNCRILPPFERISRPQVWICPWWRLARTRGLGKVVVDPCGSLCTAAVPSPRDVIDPYPFDPFDRLWQSYGDVEEWTNITTSTAVDVSNISSFDTSSKILWSAATPVNRTQIDFTWSPDSFVNNDNTTYLLLLYFAELQRLSSNALREFDILVDNATWNGSQRYTPKYLSAELVKKMVQGSSQHTVSLVATTDATLPPILNAFEIYSVLPMTELATNDADVKAMMTIRTKYALKKNWMGDPCVPKAFARDDLNCSYTSSGPASITALRLSSSGLSGDIDASFGDLRYLQHLDLSNNSLSGLVPDFLAQMPSLTFMTDNNANLCGDGVYLRDSEQETQQDTCYCNSCSSNGSNSTICGGIYVSWTANNASLRDPSAKSNVYENRQFTYKELKLMTANFKEEIGRGGFGSVFLGHLENGSPVAVKMCSKTTSQGDKEFSTEAQHLTRIHHRNLVSMIGYCKEKKHLGLIYEYMHGGNLDDRLKGKSSASTPLTWHQRLKIALDSAHGLEYLHKACQPPLIHRDVKTTNILLSADLEAKISDFGLMKVFADEFRTHITTQPAGTLGYLDPEYYNTSRLSEKSDVYSFGIVLLELITGQPPAVPISDTESIHIPRWVREKLSVGEIESIADRRMGGEYDVNSVWKVAELALQCIERPSHERPTMTEVVLEVKESLAPELLHSMGYYSSAPSSTVDLSATSIDMRSDAQASDARQDTMFELEKLGDGSVTRMEPAPR
ncbi:hypothetical protein PR202_gb23986 [Eleusine coracana subsp. coracana]|uniref:non-specific serine/threonine protein kinase n=1 Tax=Eleusine coracana subsp. coracana TaxID=191504 RepID=A0AAV5FLT4_ELECO|nr:hypothetical protein PR202_gb23986 [Eleusine coracana subsp. coracana]